MKIKGSRSAPTRSQGTTWSAAITVHGCCSSNTIQLSYRCASLQWQCSSAAGYIYDILRNNVAELPNLYVTNFTRVVYGILYVAGLSSSTNGTTFQLVLLFVLLFLSVLVLLDIAVVLLLLVCFFKFVFLLF